MLLNMSWMAQSTWRLEMLSFGWAVSPFSMGFPWDLLPPSSCLPCESTIQTMTNGTVFLSQIHEVKTAFFPTYTWSFKAAAHITEMPKEIKQLFINPSIEKLMAREKFQARLLSLLDNQLIVHSPVTRIMPCIRAFWKHVIVWKRMLEKMDFRSAGPRDCEKRLGNELSHHLCNPEPD